MRSFSTKIALSAGAVLFGIVATTPARATIFDFSAASIGSPGDLISGALTANETSPGVYDVVSISGTFDGNTITGLSSYASADNELFYPVQPYVDFQGISFSTTSLGDINLFSNSGYFEVKSSVDSVGYSSSGTPITLSVAPVPEASTWAMMIIGFLGLGFIAYGRSSGSALRIA